MSIQLSVNDCGSVSNIDPALYVLSYIIKNNYSGGNGVSNVSISAFTSAGTNITPSAVKWIGSSPSLSLVFTQSPSWDIEVDFPLNCGSYTQCSINSVTISGNWGSIGWAVTFNTSQCSINGANGSTVPVFIKGSFTESNQAFINNNKYSMTNYYMLSQAWWVEFWSEAFNQLISNFGVTPASWNSGSPITGLGLLVYDQYNNLQYAYNAPSISNKDVNSMSLQTTGVANISSGFEFSMVINASITPLNFTLGRVIVYMYFNVKSSSSATTPIGLQGYATANLTVSNVQWSNSYNAFQYNETVTQPSGT